MNKEPRDIKIIFSEALEIENPQDRIAYLNQACGQDEELRAKIEQLLTAHNQAGSFFNDPNPGSGGTLDKSPLAENAGTVIDNYRLIEKIGEGGMAVVFLAQQERPLQRQVALKIIKLGMDTQEVITRFEIERQALAMMDHANIAKVFDAGATETGRPYFVMELVKGLSITKYCQDNNLGIQERLNLFIQVCHAIQHAHQNGIIHRDIKPTNILVTQQDGIPVSKVIDFGIAKAINQRLTEKTVFTQYAELIGTPEYMSPEQAGQNGGEVDTRTDIYSLGILLYELLTDNTPFEAKRLREAGYNAIMQIIRETEPIKPSTRLSSLGGALAEVAKHRQVEPKDLCKMIRGDLDWIVMKCLEKERTHRYEKADTLATDIERHLCHLPVSVGPPSVGYRLRKFTRRNRTAVITSLLVVAALVIGVTTAKITNLTQNDSPGMVQHAAGMVQRHVWNVFPSSSLSGGISPDGQYLSYVDWTAGNLAVRDLATDTSWLVTNNTNWDDLDGWNEGSIVSPDGKQIAYSWCNEKGIDFYDLRIINMDGTDMRILYHDVSVFWIRPYAWSPDGTQILAYFSDATKNLKDENTGEFYRKGYLVLISIADGTTRVLKTWLKRTGPIKAFFSPDGRYVVYDFGQGDNRSVRDIYIMELGGDEFPLIQHPADDQLCGWEPDGQRVIFASDRSPTRGLWMIEVMDGAPQGSARLLKEGFYGFPIGFTLDNSFFYGVSTSVSNVYVAKLDATGIEFEYPPQLASSRFVGSTCMEDWSPDGNFLLYLTGMRGSRADGRGVGDRTFVIKTIETGQERILTPSSSFRQHSRIRGCRWLSDGRSLLVYGEGMESGLGFYRIDVDTGLTTLIAKSNGQKYIWSPDGASIYTRSEKGINRLDLVTGQETELYQGKSRGTNIDVSPDGQWLAFNRTRNSMVVLPSIGGELREVVHRDDEELTLSNAFMRWTPDSEYLLFCKYKGELWKVHVGTGTQTQIGVVKGKLDSAVMHPDGTQIAFTVRQTNSQLWVMENFLPD